MKCSNLILETCHQIIQYQIKFQMMKMMFGTHKKCYRKGIFGLFPWGKKNTKIAKSQNQSKQGHCKQVSGPPSHYIQSFINPLSYPNKYHLISATSFTLNNL
jgi:hypothetical protein